MYEEGKEALFWDDPAECALKCEYALSNSDTRAAIAAAGRGRIHANGDFNERIMESIIGRILSRKASRREPETTAT
jgi:spore maturation protein CgeB